MPKQLFFVLCLAAICSVLGCNGLSKNDSRVSELNQTNIQKLSNSFVFYSAYNQNQSPKNKEELISWIESYEYIDRGLKLMNIERSTYKDLFVSPNDGLEFNIRWGVPISAMGSKKPIVFEQEGVDGVRQVGFSDGTIVDVSDDDEYQTMFKGKVDKDAGKDEYEEPEDLGAADE